MHSLMPPVDTPDSKFHDGNPLTGELGTIVNAGHLNNVQDAIRDAQAELIAVLSAAGHAPDSSAGQLLIALRLLFAAKNDTLGALASLVGANNKLPYFTGANTAALTDISDIGRSVIGQASIANLLTYLGLKEAAKRDIGTGANQVPDMSSFSVTGNVNSFVMQLPGGIVIQGGIVSTDANGFAVVNLGLAMSFYSVLTGESAVSNWVSAGNVYSGLVIYGAQSLGTTSFGFRSVWWQGADKTFKGSPATAHWIAVGRV